MSDKKLVTQIMCYYNEKKYLGDAIRSILAQSYANWELILIDDGSTDGSHETAESFQDDRIIHVSNKENHGLAWCRNQGLSLAKGEYIGFVDADDIARKDKLKKMVDYLDSHEDVLVLSGGCIYIDKYGNKLSQREGIICEDADIRAYMLFGNCMAGPCALFRRAVIDKYHIAHDIVMRTSQDYFFWQKCLRHGKFYNLEEPLFYYRIGHNSQSNRTVKRDPEKNQNILLKILHYAWRSRGFRLNRGDITYIYRYIYHQERFTSFNDYIKGYKLYRKIKKQESGLNLPEGSQILALYKEFFKKHMRNDIKHIAVL